MLQVFARAEERRARAKPEREALVGLGLVALARAAPAEHKITGLPGAPANLSFSQYAGSVEVDADLGKSLFYWFVESQSATPGGFVRARSPTRASMAGVGSCERTSRAVVVVEGMLGVTRGRV